MRQVRSMRGQTVDMALLAAQNPHKVALNGVPRGKRNYGAPKGLPVMNARGDVLGKGGVIAVPREQVAREYHKNNPKAVKQMALRDVKKEVMAFDTPAQALAKAKEAAMAQAQNKKRKIVDSE